MAILGCRVKSSDALVIDMMDARPSHSVQGIHNSFVARIRCIKP